MIITVKILQGKECTIEVTTSSSISIVKQLVARELDIPVDQQRLVFRGRTLSDSQCLGDYNIIDGTKLHLMIRKTECLDDGIAKDSLLLWNEIEKVLLKHFSQNSAKKVLEQFKQEFSQTLQHWNLDDIERLAHMYMDKSTSPATDSSENDVVL